MYKFTDTIKAGAEPNVLLPSEAISIDGVFLDAVVPGFKTLTVSGREPLEMEIEDQRIMHRYYVEDQWQKARVITVKYQMTAPNAGELNVRQNKLNSYLNFSETTIQFNDEMDKYFVGTKADSDTPPAGKLSYVSSFDIYCPDPHKYEVVVTSAAFTKLSNNVYELELNNTGTVPVPVDYRVKLKKESGFLGVVSEYGAMEFGKREEADGVNYQDSETMLNTFDFSEFTPSHGKMAENASKATAGELKVTTVQGKKMLVIDEFGPSSTGWKGGMWEWYLPADTGTGEIGAENWYCYFNEVFWAGLMGQTAATAINFVGDDDVLIASYIVEKMDASGNTAVASYRVGDGTNSATPGVLWKQIPFTSSHLDSQNPFNMPRGHTDIIKEGAKISFYWWGGYHRIEVPALKNIKTKKIQLYIGQYTSRNTSPGSDDMVTHAGYRNVLFMKNNVTRWRDIPNRFPAGTNLLVDSSTGTFYVNEMPSPKDEVTGTEYFMAPPGKTKVQIVVSSFSEIETATAEFRKGWL